MLCHSPLSWLFLLPPTPLVIVLPESPSSAEHLLGHLGAHCVQKCSLLGDLWLHLEFLCVDTMSSCLAVFKSMFVKGFK